VAVLPDRILWIEAEVLLPELVDDRRHGHRRPGVTALRLLHGVHRQRADRVDGQIVDACAHGLPSLLVRGPSVRGYDGPLDVGMFLSYPYIGLISLPSE